MAITTNKPLQFLQYFIQHTNADVNARGHDGELPIHAAAIHGNLSMVRFLVQNGANHKAEGILHKTILHVMASHLNENALDYFVNQLKLDINGLDYNQDSVMHSIVRSSSNTSCQAILKYRPDLTLRNRENKTALELAREIKDSPFNLAFTSQNIVSTVPPIVQLIEKHEILEEKRNKILQTTSNSHSLNLANLDINDNDLSFIEKTLIKSRPEQIDLSGNQISDMALQSLILILLKHDKLISINLNKNPISQQNYQLIQTSVSVEKRLEKIFENYDNFEYGEKQSELINFYAEKDIVGAGTAKQEGWKLVHFAAYWGNINLLKNLKALSLDMAHLTEDGNDDNILHLSISGKREEVALWLIEHVSGLIVQQKNGKHPLFLALENKLSKAVLKLLKQNIDPNSINTSENILLVAAKNLDSDSLEHLLSHGTHLPQFLYDTIVKEVDENEGGEVLKILEKYRNGIIQCFDLISNNNPVRLDSHIKNNQPDLEGENSEGHSMLYNALVKKHWECAAILIAEGGDLSQKERAANLYSSILPEEKTLLRNALLKYFVRPENAIISYFVSRIRFIGRQKQQMGQQLNVQGLFEELYTKNELSNKYIMPILEIIEYASTKIDIIFDFNKDNVEMINPTQEASTSGATVFTAGKIYIGAKRTIEDVRGTLIHELCHFAMQLVYQNDCNPYFKSDDQAKKQYQKIKERVLKRFEKEKKEQQRGIKNSEKKEYLHEIIERAFSKYSESHHDSELIVRIPHLIGQLKENGLKILEEQVPELLQYYNEVIYKDFQIHLEQQKIRYFQIDVEGRSFGDILSSQLSLEQNKNEINQEINLIQTDKPLSNSPSCSSAMYPKQSTNKQVLNTKKEFDDENKEVKKPFNTRKN